MPMGGSSTDGRWHRSVDVTVTSRHDSDERTISRWGPRTRRGDRGQFRHRAGRRRGARAGAAGRWRWSGATRTGSPTAADGGTRSSARCRPSRRTAATSPSSTRCGRWPRGCATAYPRIDVLANNAGGTVRRGGTTVDGFEATIQANHLAPFLLSHELRDARRGAGGSSTPRRTRTAQGRLDPDDLNGERPAVHAAAAYGAAKQANILFAAEAARRWPEILSTSFHPGVVRTRFGPSSPLYRVLLPLHAGAAHARSRAPTRWSGWPLWTRRLIMPGGYYVDRSRPRPTRRTADPAQPRRSGTPASPPSACDRPARLSGSAHLSQRSCRSCRRS